MHFPYFSSGLESIFLAGKHYKGQMRSSHFSDFLFLFFGDISYLSQFFEANYAWGKFAPFTRLPGEPK